MIDWEQIKQLENAMGSTIQDYKFLYGIVSLIRPKLILETGTNTGVSAIVMASALQDEKVEGKIITIDINLDYLKIAAVQAAKVGVKQFIDFRRGDSTELIKKLGLNLIEIDLAFLDGEHTIEKLREEFGLLRDKCRYILFHDLQIEEVDRFASELFGVEWCMRIDKCKAGQQYSKGEVVYESFPGFALVEGGLK